MMKVITTRLSAEMACFLLLLLPPCGARLVRPTAEQLAWQDLEMGALVQYNIGLFGELSNNYACANGVLPPEAFAPATPVDTDAWAGAARSFGAKYALLTVQAGCGFLLYPTNTSVRNGTRYPYTTRAAPSPTSEAPDIVKRFVDSCRAAGIRPGLYYQVANNVFCNVTAGKVNGGKGAVGPCGNQTQYEELAVAQLRELWGSAGYGALSELWFDGGVNSGKDPTPASLAARISALIAQLQPAAVAFQAPYVASVGGSRSLVRWAGTESGITAVDTWSTARDAVDYGAGEADSGLGAVMWAPVECDATLQANGEWYWQQGVPLRSVQELAALYDSCVGHNGNLLLAVHPTFDGGIDPAHAQRGREFGQWITDCYGPGALINSTAPANLTAAPSTHAAPDGAVAVRVGSSIMLGLDSGTRRATRAVLEEMQCFGQRIRGFSLEAWTGSGVAGSGDEVGVWTLVATGASIGHKRVIDLGGGASVATVPAALRLNITAVETGGDGDTAWLRAFAAYACAPAAAAAASRPAIEVMGAVDVLLVETTPVVFGDELLRFESVRSEYYSNDSGDQYLRFVGAFTGEVRGAPFGVGYGFGSAYAEGGVMFVSATLSSADPVEGLGRLVTLFYSSDLTTWHNTTMIDWRGRAMTGRRTNQTEAGAAGVDIANTSLEKGKLANGTSAYVVAFEVADSATPGAWQTFFAASTAPALTESGGTWVVLDEASYHMPEGVEHANPTLRFIASTAPGAGTGTGGYWYCVTARRTPPPAASWYFFTEVFRSRDLQVWEAAPGMGAAAQVGTPMLAPNGTRDLAIAPARWSNARAETLHKFAPFIQDVDDVNTSDLDLCEWNGSVVMYFVAGQQHYDNVLVAAYTGNTTLGSFLSGFFAASAPNAVGS